MQTAKAKQQALIDEQKGLASLKNALSGSPIDGKVFSDMEDDDDDDDDDQVHMITVYMLVTACCPVQGTMTVVPSNDIHDMFCNSCALLHELCELTCMLQVCELYAAVAVATCVQCAAECGC